MVRSGLPALALLLAAATAAGQQPGPRPLFPSPAPPAALPAPAPVPQAPVLPPIEVAPLPPPEAALGLATAESELQGPLWSEGAPPGLIALLRRLPTDIAEPTLRQLQLALLAAPGPRGSDDLDLLLVRIDRLLAMDAPETALELIAAVPPSRMTPRLRERRLLAWLAADRIDQACAAARAETAAMAPWPQARVVCAALAGETGAVELGLDLMATRGQEAPPELATLARAQAAGDRATLAVALPNDPLLLPLLRRVQLDVRPELVPSLPLPARRALLANARLASTVRAAAATARPGPSARPELNGAVPGDWQAAFASVPPARREPWAALVDGLGLALPEAVWNELGSIQTPAGRAPALDLWRGFEMARASEQRGGMLLYVLLLLDGRPEAAAAVTLRRALDALVALDLQPAARALAAGTGGALGL